jgi:hypothetical protein
VAAQGKVKSYSESSTNSVRGRFTAGSYSKSSTNLCLVGAIAGTLYEVNANHTCVKPTKSLPLSQNATIGGSTFKILSPLSQNATMRGTTIVIHPPLSHNVTIGGSILATLPSLSQSATMKGATIAILPPFSPNAKSHISFSLVPAVASLLADGETACRIHRADEWWRVPSGSWRG